MGNSPLTLEHETIVLERLKYAAQRHLSAQMAHSARGEAVIDHTTGDLVARLRVDLLRHKVDAQTVHVPFEKTATQETPAPRYVVLVFAFLVAITVAVGAVQGSLAMFLVSAAIALAGVFVYAANPPHDVSLTVIGEAVVQRDLFNAFPDATMVYPENLGDIWLPMQDVRSAVFYQDPYA